jgi:hypothetical protein
VNIDLLEFVNRIGRIHPGIYDIIPRGPQRDGRVFSAFSPGAAVELNPQPIPPGVQLQFAAARVAHEIAHAAIAAEAAGNDDAAERIVSRAVEDICGTPTGHHPVPWPHSWPIPDIELPAPIPWRLVETVRLVAALTLASVGSQVTEGAAREALGHGAERLMEVALAGQTDMEAALAGQTDRVREPAHTGD